MDISARIKAMKDESFTELQPIEVTQLILQEFCNREDAIYCESSKLIALFKEWCKEKGYPDLPTRHIGRAICSLWQLKTTPYKINSKSKRIYVSK